MQRRKHVMWLTSGAAVLALGLLGTTGVALAASGGGYNPDQNDCPWNADSWATPPNYVPPGCHDFAVNVESGGTTNGDPNSTNVRYAEFGIDASPNNPGNPSFGQEENIGDPGTADSPHSGCLSVNDDGTDGGTGTGCGSNPKGAGFEANWDYYAVYCPALAMLPFASTPDPAGGSLPALYQCSPGQPVEQPSLTVDHGTDNALALILTQGLLVYMGAYDNLDNGEHDGFDGLDSTDGAINGPSDGGGAVLSIEPQALLSPATPTATHPEGLINESEGECADSICAEETSQQQTVYYGCDNSNNPATATWTGNGVDGATNPQNNTADDQCASGTPENTDAFQNNTPASTQESFFCNSGGPDGNPPAPLDSGTEWPCYTNSNGTPNETSDQSSTSGPGCTTADNGQAPNTDGSDQCGGANAYRQNTPQQVNAEPGVQTYEDPDPQRSPALPFGTPGTYVGTCGVYANDGSTYEPGVSGTVLGSTASTSNPVTGQPFDDPGWIVETDPSC